MPFVPRTLAELTQTDDPAWPLVQQWIAEAKNPVEVLPPAADAPDELLRTQVTVRSPMGAIVYHTGGLLIDGGWIRFLGSGHPRLPRSLMGWNQTRWREEIATLGGDQVISLAPPLWTAEGKDPSKSSRAPAPVSEAYGLNVIDLPRQLGP